MTVIVKGGKEPEREIGTQQPFISRQVEESVKETHIHAPSVRST